MTASSSFSSFCRSRAISISYSALSRSASPWASASLPSSAATSIRETRLVGATVISIDEKETGEVREIVDDGGSTKAVVEYEGLLGGKRVAIPIADFTLIAEGRARVGLSEAEIKDLPNYGG